MSKKATLTPIRRGLRQESSLQAKVSDGMGAVEKAHHKHFDDSIRRTFIDSLALDAALQPDHGGERRWDYLVGHGPSAEIVAVEPHSAKRDQIRAVIQKRAAAREQLKPHLGDGVRIARWLWVSSGTVQFPDTDKARRHLDQHGIQFVGRKVLARHLPAASDPPRQKGKTRRRP